MGKQFFVFLARHWSPRQPTKHETAHRDLALRAYKRQPIIEKRFSQLKSDFCVAPVYLKEVSRIESLPLYHEGRDCRHPTTRRVIEAMKPISRHRLETNGSSPQDLYTDPNPLQSQLIKLFGITEINYG